MEHVKLKKEKKRAKFIFKKMPYGRQNFSLSLSLLTYIEIKSLRIAISSDIHPWCRPRADRCIYNQVNFKTRGLASSLPHDVNSNSRLLAVSFWNRIYFPYPLCILRQIHLSFGRDVRTSWEDQYKGQPRIFFFSLSLLFLSLSRDIFNYLPEYFI